MPLSALARWHILIPFFWKEKNNSKYKKKKGGGSAATLETMEEGH